MRLGSFIKVKVQNGNIFLYEVAGSKPTYI